MLVSFIPALLIGCIRSPTTTAPVGEATRCTLLTVNDSYRIEEVQPGRGGMARLRSLRASIEAEGQEVVLLHGGDFLFPSLPSRLTKGAHMVEALNLLDGDAAAMDPRMLVVFGNHEFDDARWKHAPALRQRMDESQFLWLGSNITFGRSDQFGELTSPQLRDTTTVTCGSLTLGLFGLTIDSKHPEYVESFGDPLEVARQRTAALRAQGVDQVIALTHQSLQADTDLLATLGDEGPDLVIGGHEHDWKQVEVGGRHVLKADADLRTAWRVDLTRGAAGIERRSRRLELDTTVAPDAAVEAEVERLLVAHATQFCGEQGPGCLDEPVGRAGVVLVGEELTIRRFETNLGSWVADLARAASPEADLAFVNSGGLRLNRDIAAGPITRREIEELFAFPSPLVRLELDGATLQRVIERSIEDWTGNGHWLQVSGISFVHDPVAGTATGLTLRSTGALITPDQRLVAVVPSFLVDPSLGDQDGYTLLSGGTDLSLDLKDLVLGALAAAPAGIAPQADGRICTVSETQTCR